MQRAGSWASSRQNTLLAALPDFERERVERNLQPVFLPLGEALYEPGTLLDYAYFPATAMVSIEYLMADGASAAIAAVGNEGLVGIALFMGGESRPNQAVVQIAGWAYRLKSRFLREEFARGGPLQHLLLRYTMALIVQTAQTAVCNRHHAIDRQLCRWLLLTLDRVPSTVLMMTHEQLAHMLGVRREGVTEAVGILQKLGFLHGSRGRIIVVDRDGIEEHCCECYGVVQREFDRLLPHVTPPVAVSPDRSGRYSTWNVCPEVESSARACRGSLGDRVAPLIDLGAQRVSGLPGGRGAARAGRACRTCAAR